MAREFRSVIDRFYGLNRCEGGETRLKRGESPEMKNLMVTRNYTLLQRKGWERVCNTQGVGRGLYIGELTTWVVNENVYILENGEARLVGSLDSTEGDVFIFPFESKVYYLDGVKIKVWNGSELTVITPYVPTIALSCDYNGGGIAYEEVNLLTGTKKQAFTPDGSHAVFRLAEKGIDRVNSVKIGDRLIASSKYTVDTENGLVTMTDVPKDTTPSSLVITYTKESDTAKLIHSMRYAIAYGGENDTRIFLWGDEENPLHLRYSGVHDGVSDMTYFPELSFNKMSADGRITSAVRHYDKLLIFTERGAFQCSGELSTDANGMERMAYPVTTVSSQVGCEANNFALLVDNCPVTLSGWGLYRWSSSSIRDERNAQEIGSRIRGGLKELGVEGVRSFDRATDKELYIWSGDRVYVYNYGLDVFYYYEGFGAVAFAQDKEGVTWFLREDGALCRYTEENLDDGEPIPFFWKSAYDEHEGLDTKNIHCLEFEIYPVSSAEFNFFWASERLAGRYETLGVSYSSMDFSGIDFDGFTFFTAVTPVRIYKRIKAKRVRGFKLMIEGDGRSGALNLLGIAVSGRKTDTR